MKSFRSPGKLLLTGEYLILDGALGLALPTVFGQDLLVEIAERPGISWTSEDPSGQWLSCNFSREHLLGVPQVSFADQRDPQSRLLQLLQLIFIEQPDKIPKNYGWRVRTRTDFSRTWGLGSSSTLLANLSKWLGTDPYYLLKNSFGGSGYDIAVAMTEQPLLFELSGDTPKVTPTSFNPSFSEQLLFVYLKEKMSSMTAVRDFRRKHMKIDKKTIDLQNSLTQKILNCTRLQEFESLLEEHEQLLSKLLGLPVVKEERFPDFPGAIKSLGAWGGDFVMATGGTEAESYFRSKGYHTFFRYQQIIKNPSL